MNQFMNPHQTSPSTGVPRNLLPHLLHVDRGVWHRAFHVGTSHLHHDRNVLHGPLDCSPFRPQRAVASPNLFTRLLLSGITPTYSPKEIFQRIFLRNRSIEFDSWFMGPWWQFHQFSRKAVMPPGPAVPHLGSLMMVWWWQVWTCVNRSDCSKIYHNLFYGWQFDCWVFAVWQNL